MGEAVPGTPSIVASPSYVTLPSGVRTRASISLRVLTLWMRTDVTPSRALTKPASIAKGATAASMLPQLGEVSTVRSVTFTWANR